MNDLWKLSPEELANHYRRQLIAAEAASLRAFVGEAVEQVGNVRQWLPEPTDLEDPDDIRDFAKLRKDIAAFLAKAQEVLK